MFNALFPSESQLAIQATSIDGHQMTITPTSSKRIAYCPACEQSGARVHSHYVRQPADLPCLGHAVRLHLQTRRFFCDNQNCGRITFAEQYAGLIAPKQRRPHPLSAAAASWLLVKDRSRMGEEEVAARQRLIDADAQVASVAGLVMRFAAIARQREGPKLTAWLQSAAASGIEAMVGFANGILADLSAGTNAHTLPWSQGQVEGQVNRLKDLKRQMYGRANFDLLRLRVLTSNRLISGLSWKNLPR